MMSRHLHIFPVLMALYLPITFIITYVMAVTLEHVKAVFPYISDTGTIPPESCVFAQLLNIYATLTFWCMYLRYKQIRRYYKKARIDRSESDGRRLKSIHRKEYMNKVCLVIGLITALGVSVVGNFQEDNLLVIHLLGAAMAFGGAGLYIWMQTFLSYRMRRLPKSHSCCLSARVVLSIFYGAATFITNTAHYGPYMLTVLLCTKLSLDKFTKPWSEIKRWTSDDPGYTEHLFATFAEWVMAIISSVYFLTFTIEFKVMKAKVVVSSNHGLTTDSSSVLANGEETTTIGGLPIAEQLSTETTYVYHDYVSEGKPPRA